MKLSVSSLRRVTLGAWLVLWSMAMIFFPGSHLYAGPDDDLRHKLERGEIIVTATAEPDTCLKHGEMIGVIDASPEIVWQVITDVNNFKYFMPRTLNSMAVAPEKVPLIVKSRPNSAKEVERLLGPTPADPATYRIPGGKYTVYLYSNLDFPWPCKNRWYIIKGQNDETRAAQHRYHSSWSLVTGDLNENSGEWISGTRWRQKPRSFISCVPTPAALFPGALVKQGTFSTMPQIIAAVGERAQKSTPGKWIIIVFRTQMSPGPAGSLIPGQ